MKTSGLLLLFLIAGCSGQPPREVILEEKITETANSSEWPRLLSEVGLFTSPLRSLNPAADVFSYTINAPLFSDYSIKKRFIRLPKGKKAIYHQIGRAHV